MHISKTYLFIILILFTSSISAQEPELVINEFLASNQSSSLDPDYSKFSDWIEIYNTTSHEINLNGYFLSDNPDNPSKWQIPDGILISGGNYFLFWADGKDSVNHTSFKLDKSGEAVLLSNRDTVLIDMIPYGAQLDDISYGRVPQNLNQWMYFDPPSPEAQNDSSNSLGITPSPLFSLEGGFFTGSQTLSFLNSGQTQIYFTLDGKPPDKESILYKDPFTINKTTVVRAISYETKNPPSDILTYTYFIDEEVNLPIISLVTDPDNFFDDEIGIYVTGTNGTDGYCDDVIRNLKQDWERPVNIEFYETNGKQKLNQQAGIKIFGGCSRHRFPQKSLALFARSQYGKGSFNYRLFPEKDIDKFESFILRSSADDQVSTFFRDALGQLILVKYMDADYQAFRPAAVFLNGEYWGIHNIREKINEHYLADNFGVNKDEVNILQNRGRESDVSHGSNAGYEDMIDFADENDLSIQSNYDFIADQMDINQYIDYQIGHIYLAERDWPGNNIKYWRANSGEYTKWRWINFDLDGACTYFARDYNMIQIATQEGGSGWPNPDWSTKLLRNLLKNEGFKNEFIQRYAYHMETTFQPQRIIRFADSISAIFAPEMPRHIDRWGGQRDPDFGEGWLPLETFESMELWLNNVDTLKFFAEDRPEFTRQNFIDFFRLSGASRVDLALSDSNAGVFSINDKIHKNGFSGLYFNDIPTKISVKPRIGYTFSHWELEGQSALPETIFEKESEWKYSDSGSDLGTGWIQNNYDDSDWSSGFAQFGYGDGDENTNISYGNNPDNKFITTYFRKSFNIIDPSKYLFLNISLLIDDGAVAYLNGHEIARLNMPDGGIDYLTIAPESIADEDDFTVFKVPAEYLNTGLNLIAVEVHQTNITSSDLSFDCGFAGYTDNNNHSNIISNPDIEITFSGDITLIAHFDRDTVYAVNPVIISEINYNSSSTFNCGDWVELYNNSKIAINMTGWQFLDTSENIFEFPEDYLFPPGEFIILCADSAKFRENNPSVNNMLFEFKCGLKNEGELIKILDGDNFTVDKVLYSSSAPWPVNANGTGYTIELFEFDSDNNKAENWLAANLYGTPGKMHDIEINYNIIPNSYILKQNYPNPFNPITTIKYEIPNESVRTGEDPNITGSNNLQQGQHLSLPQMHIKLCVYDILGREIQTLVNENQSPGTYEVEFNGSSFSSGIYFYRIQAGDPSAESDKVFVDTKKMMLLK